MAADKDWGKWRRIRDLGEGGQAHTFLVEDPGAPGAQYVLKRLKNIKRIGRFRNEVAAGLTLNHPNIVKAVDQGLNAEKPWFVMEYCTGGTLQFQPDVPLLQRIEMFQSICEAIAYAHSQGIVHRDIKPDNIFIRADGSPAVGDFGLCFLTETEERFTFSHEAVGPHWYMAPEFEDGKADSVSTRSDVYSLGKLLYWIVSGKTFAREKHKEPDYDMRAGVRESEPFLIYELLDKMIVKEPSDRYADAGAVVEAVKLLKRRIDMGAHAIGKDIPQQCNYCGLGEYQIITDPWSERNQVTSVHNFGYSSIGGSQWLILVCNHCGNVQNFRIDKTKGPGYWTGDAK